MMKDMIKIFGTVGVVIAWFIYAAGQLEAMQTLDFSFISTLAFIGILAVAVGILFFLRWLLYDDPKGG